MKHAVLITAYTDADVLHLLIDRLKSDFLVYIHIDRKSTLQINEFEEENVRIYKRFRVNWASFNHLQSILFLLGEAVKDAEIDYFHIISGQDFPAVSNESIYRFFEDHKGQSFFDFEKVSDMDEQKKKGMQSRYELRWFTDWLSYPKTFDFQSKKRIGLIERFQHRYGIKRNGIGAFTADAIYKGMVYSSLYRDAAMFALQFISGNRSFVKGLKTCLIPEEFFFQTVLLNSPLKHTVVNNNLRYMNWEYRDGVSPCVLDERDYETVRKSQCLFMRKISTQSKKLIELLNK